MDIESLRSFLSSISLTNNQINEIVREYPNIIQILKENRVNEIDISKLHGIGPYILKVIERKINSNLSYTEFPEIFGGLINLRIAKQLKKKYQYLSKIVDEMNKNPYKCLCSLDGVSFKTADSIILKLSKRGNQLDFNLPSNFMQSKDRCTQGILFLLNQNEISGNTNMSIDLLKKQLQKLVPECFHHFSNILNAHACPKEIYINEKVNTVSRSETYFTEKKIADFIKEAIGSKICWGINTAKFHKIQDFTLSLEQSQTLDMVCKNSISILTGSAGTGKSSSILALINMLKSNNKSFVLAAPTGMAAKVSSRYTNTKASTIHKLLEFDVITKSFTYGKNKKLPYDMVIIDEVSMCDVFLFCSLLEAINFKKTKLLLIGDSAQFPSVGLGNILYDLVNSKVIPVNSLTKVFRTGEGGILTAATYVRTSQSYLSNSLENQFIGNDKSYAFIPSSAEIMMENIKKLYSSLLQKGYTPKDILILSAYNKGNLGTNKINEEIQLIANPNRKFKNKNISINNLDGSKTQFYINDLVLQTKNNYCAINKQNNINIDCQFTFIPNGEIGIIKNISSLGIEIQFENTVIYQREDMKNLKLAYSISVHKSQGGCAKIVILITPRCHTFMLNSNLLYVGITRATEKVYHLGESQTINRAIRKKVDFKRETSLLNMLKGCN